MGSSAALSESGLATILKQRRPSRINRQLKREGLITNQRGRRKYRRLANKSKGKGFRLNPFSWRAQIDLGRQLLREYGTNKTAKARLWPSLAG